MIQSMTSIDNYLKQQRMKMLAQRRLKDFSTGSAETRTAQIWGDVKKTEISGKISAITGKLKAGKKLSGADMAFLRKHAPDLYEKAMMISREREGYRKRLDKARTKDEADRVHMRKMQQMSAEVRQKDADPEFSNMRLAAILDERSDYVMNGKYSLKKRENIIFLEKTKEKKAAEKELAQKLAEKEREEQEKAAIAERAESEKAATTKKAETDNLSVRAVIAAVSEKAPPAPAIIVSVKPVINEAPAVSDKQAIRQKAADSYKTASRQGKAIARTR